ncbi:MAG: hypothetical protein ACOX3T_04735 [Bdellovibrionota bacterium]
MFKKIFLFLLLSFCFVLKAFSNDLNQGDYSQNLDIISLNSSPSNSSSSSSISTSISTSNSSLLKATITRENNSEITDKIESESSKTNNKSNNETNNETNNGTKIDDSLSDNKKTNDKELSATLSVQKLALERAKRDYENVLQGKDEKLALSARNTLIYEYEKTIPLVCMPNFFKELSYNPNESSKDCQTLTDDALSIYPYSPIALCAKYGYEDRKCVESFEHIVISNSNPKNDDNTLSDLSKFLDKIDNIKISKLKDDFTKARNIYNLKITTKNFMNVIAISDQIVKAICNSTTESYSDKCQTCKNTEDELNIEKIDFFADIRSDLDKLKKEHSDLTKKEEPQINVKQVDKIIHVSKDCQNFLEEVSRFEPNYPSSICKLKGPYSPSCLNALKAWGPYVKSKYTFELRERKQRTKKEPIGQNSFESF